MASFLPGVAYHRVRDNRSTINIKTGYEKRQWLPKYSSFLSLITTLHKWYMTYLCIAFVMKTIEVFVINIDCCL